MVFFSDFSAASRLGSLICAVSIAFLASVDPAPSAAAEHVSSAPVEDTDEAADQLVREIQQVSEGFPMLAKRLGLVSIADFRRPIACIGGVDPTCHAAVQGSCLSNTAPGERPDYNFCLAQANSVCCRPAKFVITD